MNNTTNDNNKAMTAYVLDAVRLEKLQVEALTNQERTAFPGRLDERLQWAMTIQVAADRDRDDLVKTPFFEEPKLTHEEITAFRDHIELTRWTESKYQAQRVGAAGAVKAWNEIYQPTYSDKEHLLRAFTIRFRNDDEGQRRIAKIREGAGEADFVQDVSDVLVLAEEHAEWLATCPRGETEAVARLRAASPELSRLLAEKATSEQLRKAQELRDAAFSLMMKTERRIRAAADYWYRGEERARLYVAFPIVQGGRKSGAEEAPTEVAAEPVPVG